MANFVSTSAGNTILAGSGGISIDSTRRMFNFGERIAELAPQQSPFFVYLSKVAKKPTDDPVFKFLEQRHQWQRRNFKMENISESAAFSAVDTVADEAAMDASAYYDQFGKVSSSAKDASFLINKQIVAIECDYYDNSLGTPAYSLVADAYIVYLRISGVTDGTDGTVFVGTFVKLVKKGSGVVTTIAGDKWKTAVGSRGQVVGSAWAEAETAPLGWEDKLFDREGYTQIFKTGMNLFSGTAMATRYRGIASEYKRVWQEKLMEHKMDLEHAMLFGVGAANEDATPLRYSWGILPYTESYGKVYSMTYASSGYDAFLDAMEDFFAPEGGNSGNKLVLSSRKVLTYLNKLGNGSFMNNTVGSSQYRLDIANVPGKFGHNVTVINTIYGNLHFVAEPLLRGMWEDYCVCVDMKNVAYRPLIGNGNSRDTSITTNIQTDETDGRRDMILTEAGLEISLPETHAILKFS